MNMACSLPGPLVPPAGRRDVFMDLAKTLKIDSVSRLHPSPPLRISPTQTVAEGVALMRQEGVGYLLVCEGERMVGIFTERDLMRRGLAGGEALDLSRAGACEPRSA